MLTPKEKRFLRYWNDQKTGGKWQYILVYTLGWSFILFFIPLAVSFFVNMYMAFRLYQLPIWATIVLALVIGFALSQFMWHKNENREKILLSKQDETG